MDIDFYNGGAFAECFYAQYPNGMGLQPTPPMLARRLAEVASGQPSSPISGGSPLSAFSRRVPEPAAVAPSHLTAPVPNQPLSSPGPSVHPVTSQALALHPVTQAPAVDAVTEANRKLRDVEETAARTQEALSQAAEAHLRQVRATTHEEEYYSGRQRRGRGGGSLVAWSPAATGEGAGHPVVRSPPKVGRVNANERDLPPSLRLDGGKGATADGGGVSVPFCVSSGQNKKKLIIPIEQRLVQQQPEGSRGAAVVGESVMRLARSMPQAVKDVAAELQARAEARAAVEERAQAASEAEEIARAKKLLEENTVAATQQQRRRETREERLERLRLERELREREQQQKRRQRQLETAAARLHISVEDLEADEKLLRSIEENASHLAAAPVPAPSLEGYPNKDDHEERPIDEEDGLARKKPVVMFSRPVISNEGIAREMKELEKLQHDHQEQPMLSHANDGIRLPEEKEEDDDDAKPHTGKQASHSKGARGPRHDDLEDEDASFGINGLMRRRQRRL